MRGWVLAPAGLAFGGVGCEALGGGVGVAWVGAGGAAERFVGAAGGLSGGGGGGLVRRRVRLDGRSGLGERLWNHNSACVRNHKFSI